MSKQATDNDALGFSYKVSLRLESLERLNKKVVKVLDAFHGHGYIWNQVSSMSDRQIIITPIDVRPDVNKAYLKGENEKFMMTMDLKQYDMIDVDAYGSPFKQLEIILRSDFKGPVHGTFIQSVMGGINHDLLVKIGYSKNMITKCHTLFSHNGFDKLCAYLSMYGIDNINYLDVGRKFYFFFWK
jgi:hypothetical protein